jgi:predicted PurR-regulated permease PerM
LAVGSSPSRTKSPGAHPFYWLATLALVVVIISRAQEVLVPLALSALISFALTPAVRRLARRVGHPVAVALVVLVAVGAVASFGFLLERQLVELSTQMTRYSKAMSGKLAALRGSETGGLSGLSRTVDKLAEQLDHTSAAAGEPTQVEILPAKATALERFNETIAPVLRPLADFIVVLVLVIFLLSKRGDLRDRFIRLAGKRNISLTTRTLDEAGDRIGRFLIVQSAINGGFGVAISLALWFIGVPFPGLWGFVAAILRFVPFLGTILGMLLPATLAFAQLPGWSPALSVVGVFLGLDAVVAYVVEPMAVGHRTGVSSLAMIVMAVFWTWLWGPVGLVLSTPLTVCLAVLGRQVPRLEFLAVLLGDEPALDPDVMFYQRMLAGDEDEATNILEARLRVAPRAQVFDELMVPALRMAERDRSRDEISDGEYEHIISIMRTLMTNEAAAEPTDEAGAPAPSHRILGVPGPSAADHLAWEMLTQVVDPAKVSIETAAGALVSELLATVASQRPDLVFVTSVGPGGSSHLRQLNTRLLRARPGLRIVNLRLQTEAANTDEPSPASAVFVGSVEEARKRVEQVLLLTPAATLPA